MALTKISGSILKDPLNLGEVSIGGTLTYQDVTNVDSIGLGTFRAGINVSGGTGTFAGDVSIADKIIHTGDTNTAIRFPANDTISIETAGVTRATVTGNNIDFPDAGTLRFGASNDLQIYHGTGGASNIIHSNTSQPLIISASGAGAIRFDTNSNERLRIDSDGSISLPIDNQKLKFGAGNDLNIYSTGTNGWVYTPQSTADLYLGTNAGEVYIQTGTGGNDTAIKVISGGAVELYNNGTKQCQTINGGLNFQDSKKAEFGNSGDLKIYHESNVSIIKSASHPIGYYTNTRHHFLNADGSENLAVFTPNGSCALYHNGDLRLQTWSDAVNIYGNEGADAILHLYADEGDDNADKWRLLAGTAGQLDIANYSTGSWINHLTINGSGYVTKQNHPAFRAGRGSSSQSVGSGDRIIFNTTSGDKKFNTGGHYDTSTGYFTAPIAGVYTFFTHVIYQGLSDGDSMIDVFHIYVDNTMVTYSHKRSYYRNTYTGDGGYYTDTANFTGSLAAGEKVWVRHNQGSRTIHANVNYCTFEGHLVG